MGAEEASERVVLEIIYTQQAVLHRYSESQANRIDMWRNMCAGRMGRRRPQDGTEVKPKTAWAVVHSGDEIDCWDHTVPVYWLKSIALQEMKSHSFSDIRIVRVKITQVRRRMGRKEKP